MSTINTAEIREQREYTVHMREFECSETATFTVPAGTEDEQDEKAWEIAEEMAIEWVRGGSYDDEGACVQVYYYWEDGEYNTEEDESSTFVEIQPDHSALIRDACGGKCDPRYDRCCGDDPEDHEWTSEGEGGCSQNPGVWSLGGTTLYFREHCVNCGLIRMTTLYGEQRNSGQLDEEEYEMPDAD